MSTRICKKEIMIMPPDSASGTTENHIRLWDLAAFCHICNRNWQWHFFHQQKIFSVGDYVAKKMVDPRYMPFCTLSWAVIDLKYLVAIKENVDKKTI